MAHIWVLHNPLAGRPAYAVKVERAAEALARRGVSVRLERPPTVDGLRQAARAAVAAGAEAVLVAGGDGTLGAIAAELAGSSVALGCLPAGTANVWAKELNISRLSLFRPNALEQAALQLLDGRTLLADLGRCNGRLFLMWAGIGLDAFVTWQLEQRRQFARQYGFLYNTAFTFVAARQWRGADVRVAAGGREVAGRYLLVTVTNIGWYGGGLFRLTAEARLDDGQMDVWLFAGSTYGEALAHAGRLYIGRHAHHPQVTRLTGERVEIYATRPQMIQADGEPFGPTDQVSIQVVPRILRVLVPAQKALEAQLSDTQKQL